MTYPDKLPATEANRLRLELDELIGLARYHGEFVKPGTLTESGWRVLGRALLTDDLGDRRDLWAVQAPGPDESVHFLATGVFLPVTRVYRWPEVERLVAVTRTRAAETEALLAAAQAARPEGAQGIGPCGERVVPADWLVPSRWSGIRRGHARVRLYDGQPIEVEDGVLLGSAGDVVKRDVRALRIGRPLLATELKVCADRLLERAVWVRPLEGAAGFWRRGRLRLDAERVVFTDEPAAEAELQLGDAPLGGRRAAQALSDVLGAGLLDSRSRARRGADAGGAYAALLGIAVQAVRWRRRGESVRFGGGGGPRPFRTFGGMEGEEEYDPDVALAGVLDDEVVADLRAIGWERVG